MQRLIILFFLLPWWAYVPIAGGVAYLGNEVYKTELRTEAEREAALALGAPDPVDLATFDRDVHIGPADEVNVLGWINTEYNYTLTKRTNGVKTSEKYLYMLFGMADEPGARAVRAAIVFSERERDYFIAHVDEYIVSYQKELPLFRFGGFAAGSDGMGSMISEAIEEQGLRKSDDFFYLEPFLAGREAALVAQGAPENARKQFWAAALAIALLGLAKRVFGWGRRPSEASAAIDPRKAVQVQAPAGANKAMDYDYTFKAKRRDVELSKDISPDSPLGRLAMRGAPVPAVAAEGPAAPVERGEDSLAARAAELAVEKHLALRKHMIRTPITFALFVGVAVLGIWTVALRVGQEFVPLAILGSLGVLAVFALNMCFRLFSKIMHRQKAMKMAGLSMRELKALARGEAVAVADADEVDEAVRPTKAARTKGRSGGLSQAFSGIGRGPMSVFWLAALCGALGYTNQGPVPLVSFPINGYDPFADSQLLYGLAGVFLVLALFLWLRAGRAGGEDAVAIIPRVEQDEVAVPAVAKVADSLSGSRAWVRSAGKGKPSSPTAVNVDMRDRMKVDPFDRFAEQTRALR
ncbi:MAG: hypothetical protein VX874_04940 [Pseudomonadota bacterium]|nr:hypothetical protein [Pseudomonadota bacterium]